MEKKFAGKTILVTGATGGIGRATCLAFAARGARVLAHYRSDEKAAKSLVKAMGRFGKGHAALFADLARPDSIAELFKGIGKLDVLVNNAGYCPKNAFLDVPLEELEQVMNVNFRAPFLCSQAAARLMKRGAAIVFVASIDGFHPGQGRTHYGASKAAELNLMRNVALELAPRGIRVNAVAPGAVDTPMISRVKADRKREAAVLAGIPQGRFGNPSEIAEAVCFLAEAGCAYATGATLTVDGGLTLVRGY
ncbi:MAG: SDR family oxidoreductase [Spirochaetes bacterium]|nr:SDR family oxidoreductase [Spirochaetota bacterium]